MIYFKSAVIGILFTALTTQSIAQDQPVVKATILETDNEIADKLYNSGIEQFKNKQFNEAIKSFTEAISKKVGFEKCSIFVESRYYGKR